MVQAFYQPLDQQWTPALKTGVSQVISNALGAVAPEIATAITIYIMIQGMLIMFRQYDVWRGMTAIGRAAVVSLLLTGTYFSQYVETPFTTTIPNFIGRAVSGGAEPQASAQQFDAVWTNVTNFVARIDAQASGLEGIAYRVEARLISLVAEIGLGASFLVWIFALSALNLVVCIGPFVIGTYLFAALREVSARWLGKMIGMLALLLLVSVLLQIVLMTDKEAVRMAMADGGGIDVQLRALQTIAFTFVMGGALLLCAPTIAAYIGGGAVFTVATMPLLWLARRMGGRR